MSVVKRKKDGRKKISEQVNKIKQARRSAFEMFPRGVKLCGEQEETESDMQCHREVPGEINGFDVKLQHTEEERSNSRM